MGVLMYEILAGHLPLKGHDALSTMSKHTNETPERLDDIDPDPILAKKMEKTIFKCLKKEPKDRYQKMDELGRELELVQLYSEQARAGRTNKIRCAIERAWLFQSQLIRGVCKPVLSKRIKSSEITVGSILSIASIALILAAILGLILLFGLPFFDMNIANRELPFKPIIDTSVRVTDEKLAEVVWTKLQTPNEPKDTPLLKQVSELFLRVADSNKKVGNYEEASLWYYRTGSVIDRLKASSSMTTVYVYNSYAESCLLANTVIPTPNQIQRNQQQDLLKKHGKFITTQILRENGLVYAANAATARDAALKAMTVMRDLSMLESRNNDVPGQTLLAQGLLAESFLEFGDTKVAKIGYDQFYDTLKSSDSARKLDISQRIFVLAFAGRFYLQHGEFAKASDLLNQLTPMLTELGSVVRYDLAVIYNDLGLIKENMGQAKEAENFFSQAREYLAMCPGLKDGLTAKVSDNIAVSAFKAGDFKTALQAKLQGLVK